MKFGKSILALLLAALLLTPVATALGADVSEVQSGEPACRPYGPWPNSQYDPAKVMAMMSSTRNPDLAPLLSAHRGAWNNDIPENSISAIDNAAFHKFEMVELDLKVDNSGEAVLMHDYTLGRMAAYSAGWNAFNGSISANNERPQDHGDWARLAQFNPLVSMLPTSVLTATHLFIFNKDVGTIGSWNGAVAKGAWYQADETIPTLREALEHIGQYYPGMTVVLDLRHLNEVQAAIEAIDQVTDCQGNPAKDWVILKPFANVFPNGWSSAVVAGSVRHDIPNADNYKWIPVVSNRLVKGQTPGRPSIIPGSPGPDVSQIDANIAAYLDDWLGQYLTPHGKDPLAPVVTAELGIGDFAAAPPNFQTAYYYLMQAGVLNVQSWRPPDIKLDNPDSHPVDPSNGREIIGFNWNDDGLGVRPVHKELFRTYEQTRTTAGVITVDDTDNVLGSLETGDRYGTKKAISRDVLDPASSDPGSVYKLVNRNSDLFLDLADGAPATDGTHAIQYGYNATPNQNWRIVGVGGGDYHIVNEKTGKFLDVENGSHSDGAIVFQWYDNGAPNQLWNLVDVGNGYFKIVNKNSGKVLDIQNGSMVNYGAAIQYPYYGGLSQQWKLVKIGTYKISNQTHYLLDLADGAPATDGTRVIQYPANGTPNQMWRLEDLGGGDYELVNHKTQKLLDVEFGSMSVGAPVFQWRRNNMVNQRWNLLPSGSHSGAYKFVNKASGLALDIVPNNQPYGLAIQNDLHDNFANWTFELQP